MPMISNMKIGVRLGLGFAVIVALMLAMVTFSIRGMGKMSQAMDRIVNGVNAKSEAASEALSQMQAVLRSIDMIVMLKDCSAREKEKEKEKEKIAAARASYGASIKRLEELIRATTLNNQKEREIFDLLKSRIKPAAEANNRAVVLALAGAQETATAAAQLYGNAEELQRLVRQFRI